MIYREVQQRTSPFARVPRQVVPVLLVLLAQNMSLLRVRRRLDLRLGVRYP